MYIVKCLLCCWLTGKQKYDLILCCRQQDRARLHTFLLQGVRPKYTVDYTCHENMLVIFDRSSNREDGQRMCPVKDVSTEKKLFCGRNGSQQFPYVQACSDPHVGAYFTHLYHLWYRCGHWLSHQPSLYSEQIKKRVLKQNLTCFQFLPSGKNFSSMPRI